MSQNLAPWLQGLDEAWEVPSNHLVPAAKPSDTIFEHTTKTDHDGSFQMHPKRLASDSNHDVGGSVHRDRVPLSPVNHNSRSSLTRARTSTSNLQTRSPTASSDGSVALCGTIQQRPKSVSPAKKQETLEWKKRLIRGQVGYGDQTDLFGPSGLDNIFAQRKQSNGGEPHSQGRTSWQQQYTTRPIPSSPPMWPFKQNVTSSPMQAMDNPEDEDNADPFGTGISAQDEHETHDRDELWQEGGRSASAVIRKANRLASGQTDVEQEDFSPVLISKRITTNGHVDYQALDSRAIQKPHTKGKSRRDSNSEDVPEFLKPSAAKYHNISRTTNGYDNALQMPTDLSLSENLLMGTPPPAELDSNVQMHRGGYSRVGSFMHRPLSPSQSQATTSAVSDQIKPAARAKEPDVVQAHQHQKQVQTTTSSPLKLFGPHDTFTSNHLLRRMSHYDSDVDGPEDDDDQDLQDSLHESEAHDLLKRSFGSGRYNAYAFDAKSSLSVDRELDVSAQDSSPRSDTTPPGSHLPLGFKAVGGATTSSGIVRKSSLVHNSLRRHERQVSAGHSEQQTILSRVRKSTVRASQVYGSTKRPQNSPCKTSASKRRRTLHASEMLNHAGSSLRSSVSVSSNGSRKRKDARQGDAQINADADVLARRKILRPRNPTPAQRRKQQIKAEIREATEDFVNQEPQAAEAVIEQIETSLTSDDPPSLQEQAHVAAGEVAKFTLRIQKASGDYGERKRSVTTQDFFNEAVMVMRLIREKAGRQSGLGSVNESDQERILESPYTDLSEQDDSALRLTRPPSREGGGGWRPRGSMQTDVRKLSHLRKFQETDDTDFIAHSFSALNVADEEQSEVIAEDQYTRIREARSSTNSEDDLSEHLEDQPPAQFDSLSTHKSDGTSTGRTNITGSSRKSDNLGTLGPEVVAHLIGEQVGGMTFDKDKNQWVRAKSSPPKRPYTSFLEPSHISSDEDPFREISDLPVDEGKEEEIRKASLGVHALKLQGVSPVDWETAAEPQTASVRRVEARPTTSDSIKSRHTHTSSVPTHYSGLSSSVQQQVETRATSWSNEELEQLSAHGKAVNQPLAYAAATVALELEQHRTQVIAEQKQRPASTDAAPSAAVVSDVGLKNQSKAAPLKDGSNDDIVDDSEDVMSDLGDDSVLHLEESDVEDMAMPKVRSTPQHARNLPNCVIQSSTRQISLRRRTLTSKLLGMEPREQSELSIVAALPGEKMVSVSLSVSRPLSNRQALDNALEPCSPSKFDPSFILSDLPDFTIHEEDLPRKSERTLAQRVASYAVADACNRQVSATTALVKNLTDVRGEEPYWEDVKELRLNDRDLASLHGLDEFCDSLQKMDVSRNILTHLTGSPSTLRSLVARSNHLTCLTSWSHLTNLQYLDISGNQLRSLDAIGSLYHLRELRADDNQIASLNGILQLDGLLKLGLRRNEIRTADFHDCSLIRLQELDLCDNKLEEVHGLDILTDLKVLRLDGNALTLFDTRGEKMSCLEGLSIQRCQLTQLDIGSYPKLRTLLADDNCLPMIENVDKPKYLDLVSLRRQKLANNVQPAFFTKSMSTRQLRLSGCKISTLDISGSFLSLQMLEIASVGLHELPPDFGLKFPNLVKLNLNFNSVQDVRPLLNIESLEHLSICGNGLDRLRKSVATLAKMTSLQSVDLRGNPLTHGFYAQRGPVPVQSTIVRREKAAQVVNIDEDEDAARERIESAVYRLDGNDRKSDISHSERLDEATKMRRRVYELLLANSCRRLGEVDGLPFDQRIAMVKDETWSRLVELGVVKKSRESTAEEAL